MSNKKYHLFVVTTILLPLYGFAQSQDSLVQRRDSLSKVTIFSGALGLTNNGFSIIPSFSLNAPAALIQLSWRKNKFSIEPDARLTLDGRKGAMLFWFRYQPVEKEKFRLSVGAHPAINLQTRTITEAGLTTEISQMRRFVAWEMVPSYQLTDNWGVGIYYLQGNGLQADGPRTTHYVNLNTRLANIKLGGNVRLLLSPAVYFLSVDEHTGTYFTATGILSHTDLPFTIQSDINQTINANLPGNLDFLWNISVRYNFRKKTMVVP